MGDVRFLGCTLWTDYSLVPRAERASVIEQSRSRNPDYALIRYGERNFAPEDAIELCTRHRRWLEARLEEPYAGTTVVITHNAVIAGMADRVIRLSSGRIVEERRNERPVSPDDLSW